MEFTWYYHADLYERSTVEVTPGNTAVLLCTGGIALATVLVTVSPVLRNFPRYETNSDNDETHAMEGAIKHG